MAKSINFSVRLNVDGKEKLATATANVRDLKREIDSLQSAFGAACEKFNHVGFAMGNISSAVTSISGTLSKLTEESRSFGGAMTAANTMAGKSGKDFGELKDQVAGLAETVPVARDQLANGLYQVISNGVPEDNWISYLEKSAKASVGGIANLEEVVKVTSTVIKNYGLSWDEAGAIQDKIQLTAKNGVTSFEQMAQALPRVTANASTLGVSVDELMAAFATLTGVSGNTAEVSTQLAAIFTALVKPSSEATKMAQQMGIQFDAAAIKAAGGMKNFLTQLDTSVKQYASTSGMLEQEVYGKLFGSAESLRALTPLTGNLADKFEENVNAMAGSAGTIDDAFKTMAATGSAQLQVLKNKFGEVTDAIQSVAGGFLPVVTFGSQVLVAANSVVTLSAALSKLTLVHKAATVATTAYGVASTKVAVLVRVFSAALTGTAYSATAAKVAIKGLLVSTGVGLAIVALTTALDALCNSSDEVAKKTDELGEAEQAYQSTAAQTQASLAAEIKSLRNLIDAKKDTTAAVRELNAKYGEIFGSHKTAADWYDTLTKKSQIYARQMGYEAQMKALSVKLAEKQIQLQDNYDKRKNLWKSGGAQTTKTWKTGPGTSVSRTEDTQEYTDLKNEARELLPSISDLQRQIGITEKKMAECANQITRIDKASAGHNKTLDVSKLSYSQLKKEIENYQGKLGEATNNPKEAARLNSILKQLNARKAALEKTYSGLSTKSNTKKEPKFYKNPKTKEELSKNINYYSGKLNGKDTAEQRSIAKSIQLWKEKRAQIELTEKAALVPKEIKTSQDVDTTLDYLNTKKKYAKEGDVADINRQISKTELAGLALERPKNVSAQSTDEEINKEIQYQQKLKETAEGDTEAIDKEIKRLGLLKDKRTEIQKLNDKLDEANADYDKATTVEAKVKIISTIQDLQSQIDAKDKEKLAIQAKVIVDRAKSGDFEAKRTVYSNAQSKASRIQSDFDTGIIDKKEAQRQIEEINSQLKTVGENLKPIKIELDVDKESVDAIKSLGNIDLSNMDSVKGSIESIQKITNPTAQGFATAGAACTALGGAMQQLGADSEAAKAGMVMAAVGQIALSFAQALASCKTWVEWLAFGISGTVQMVSLINTISGFATGGIVGGNSTSGDKIPIRVNSGEMILNKAQQARLFALANGSQNIQGISRNVNRQQDIKANPTVMTQISMPEQTQQSVRFKIDGRTLVGVLANETRVSSRSGRRTNIKI